LSQKREKQFLFGEIRRKYFQNCAQIRTENFDNFVGERFERKIKFAGRKKLKIPPLDGIFYSVKKGDTLSEIAKNHGIDLKKISAYNFLPENKIAPGDEIFLPDAQKIFVKITPKKKKQKLFHEKFNKKFFQ
jgi:FOG: LysM repeat